MLNKLYIALAQRIAKQTLVRQPEMDILMMDRSQNEEFTRDGQDGSLAIVYDIIVNALLKIAPRKGKALDICCGSASLLSKIALSMPQVDFLGVDLSNNMLEFAREQRDRRGIKNLLFKQADMYKLEESVAEKFDLITWHLAMHHCDNADSVVRVLNQIPNLLKPGGTFFVFDINRPKTGDLALMIADTFNRTQGDWFYQDSLDSYKAGFSFEEIEKILQASALKNVRHVQPVFANFFQAFYISTTENTDIRAVSYLKYAWQKFDHFLMTSSFKALPTARGAGKTPVFTDVDAKKDLSMRTVDPRIIEVLEIGARAMSAYNIQPWRFRFSGDDVLVYCVRRKNFFLKLEGVYYMMIGHLLANLKAGAAARGYRFEYETLSEALSVDVPCVRLNFIKEKECREEIPHVLSRVTNRNPYLDKPVSEEVKNKIIELGFSPNSSVLVAEGELKNKFAKILSDLEYVRMSNSRLAVEAVEFIRFNEADARAHGDYLRVESLVMTPAMIFLIRVLWRLHGLYYFAKVFGMLEKIYTQQTRIINNSGAIVVFLIQKRECKNFIDLGIMVQEICNELTRLGVACMPVLSGIYLHDVLFENPEILSNSEKNVIINSFRQIDDLLKIQDQRIAYVLRIGYSDVTPSPTIRRDIHQLIARADQRITPL